MWLPRKAISDRVSCLKTFDAAPASPNLSMCRFELRRCDAIDFLSHLKKLYTCRKSPKSFTKSSDLKQHMLIHSGEKPYACKQCSKSFPQSLHLKMHMVIHSGKKQTVSQNIHPVIISQAAHVNTPWGEANSVPDPSIRQQIWRCRYTVGSTRLTEAASKVLGLSLKKTGGI